MEISEIIAVLSAAGGSVRSMADAGGAIRSLLQSESGASDELKTELSRLLDETIATKQLSLNAIVAAQELAKKLKEREDFDARMQSYKLVQPTTNNFVFQYVDGSGSDPVHFVCPQCVEDRRISILQGHATHVRCSKCGASYTVGHSTHRIETDWNPI